MKNWTKAAAAFAEFFVALIKLFEAQKVSDEKVGQILESKEFLEYCASFLNRTTYRILKHLQLLNPKLPISSFSFSRDKFLASNLGVNVYLWDGFKNWIVPELSEIVPRFTGDLASYKLTKNMYDKEIRAEIGEADVFTPDEALAIIFTIISEQPNGEVGDFENTGYANIFYIRLKSGEVVMVVVDWHSVDRVWYLGAGRLGVSWAEGNRVFVCSLPAQAG
jgi:hypothetical protein